MRCFRLFTAVLLAIISVSASAQPGSFTITGTIDPSLNITALYFARTSFYESALPRATKVQVEGGKFTISGVLREPGPAFLSVAADLKPEDPADIRQFILDQGNISISIKKTLASAAVEGSTANDETVRYTIGQAPHIVKISALNEAVQQQAEQGVPVDSILKRYHAPLKRAEKELLAYQRQFVSNNSGAFISLLLVTEIAQSSNNYFEADSLFNSLEEEIRKGPTAETIRRFINNQKKTSVGAFAPAFALADTAGKQVPLSSLKGKYVLLDFWAAWCKPCRDENPNIVRAYQRYRDRGFTVLGVSLDRDRRAWLQAIKDDNLGWQHVSDLKFWRSEAALIYGVGSIPRNFLLDPEGKIIGRDLRGPNLNEELEGIFQLGNKD